MLKDKTIALIGGGVMGEALIRGLISNLKLDPQNIIVADPWTERVKELEKAYGVRGTGDNNTAAAAADIIILAVKPQHFSQVASDIQGKGNAAVLLISIMAGVSLDQLRKETGRSSVVRSMPNTPAQIAKGITVWTGSPSMTVAHQEETKAVLQSLGEDVYVDEERYLDMATALSGTGPGYVFLFMEAMIDAGVHMGFPRRISEQLVLQTIRGSVDYASNSGKHVAELRNQVTSPGGTTAAALYHMEKGGLRTVLSRGIYAAYEQSKNLGDSKKE